MSFSIRIKESAAREPRRLRLGDNRVLYKVRDDELVVLVVRVAHRREAFRRTPG